MCPLLKKTKYKFVYGFVLVTATLLLLGCQKRYWYRQKIAIFSFHEPKKKTIHLKVMNYSRNYVSRMFENNLRMLCLQRLKKYDFVETERDTSDFNFTLKLYVDSFHVSGKGKMPRDLHAYTLYSYAHHIYQLTIEYDLRFFRGNVRYWDFKNELYFFNAENKDLRRSRSMVKYSLNQLPD